MCFFSCYLRELNLLETCGSRSTLVSTTASTVADILGRDMENFVWSLADWLILALTSLTYCWLAVGRWPLELFESRAKFIALASCYWLTEFYMSLRLSINSMFLCWASLCVFGPESSSCSSRTSFSFLGLFLCIYSRLSLGLTFFWENMKPPELDECLTVARGLVCSMVWTFLMWPRLAAATSRG